MAEPADLRRLRQIATGLELTLAAGGCDLIDEKQFQGTSTENGDECRLQAWIAYLIGVLQCEIHPTLSCCSDNEQKYCDVWEACPV